MLIIREVFIAKPGNASKLAKLMKEAMSNFSSPNFKVTIMTDLVSDFNKVVIEHEVDSLEEFEKEMKEYKKQDPKIMEKMKGYTDLFLTGKREIYQVV